MIKIRQKAKKTSLTYKFEDKAKSEITATMEIHMIRVMCAARQIGMTPGLELQTDKRNLKETHTFLSFVTVDFFSFFIKSVLRKGGKKSRVLKSFLTIFTNNNSNTPLLRS